MRALLQRVREASVSIKGREKDRIGPGLLILLGVAADDEGSDLEWLVKKIVPMRIFPDEEGRMNRSVLECGGDVLVVSQFTLHARVKKGTRPGFDRAAKPDLAVPMYEAFLAAMEKALGRRVAAGEFGADMQVSLVNDGPVTIWLDSRNPE